MTEFTPLSGLLGGLLIGFASVIMLWSTGRITGISGIFGGLLTPDTRLIAGSALFGIGWGIAGLCPGPAITALASGLLPVVGFVAAMVVGAFIYKWLFEVR